MLRDYMKQNKDLLPHHNLQRHIFLKHHSVTVTIATSPFITKSIACIGRDKFYTKQHDTVSDVKNNDIEFCIPVPVYTCYQY